MTLLRALARKGMRSLEKRAAENATKAEIKELARKGLASLEKTAAEKAAIEAAEKAGKATPKTPTPKTPNPTPRPFWNS